MDEIKTKQLAFLEETAAYYNSNNRAKQKLPNGNKSGGCFYTIVIDGEERGCAVGRKIADKELCERLNKMSSLPNCSPSANDVFSLLPPDLQELGSDFLVAIQTLHDYDGHWNEKGLTEQGTRHVHDIKHQFGLA